MKLAVGTKSVLFGVHAFWLHPWFVAYGWYVLHGWPLDPRLWVAFLVHDLGYLGSPNMQGPEGERHPELGGRIMGKLFGAAWGDFTRYHSRYYARLDQAETSPLCAADKLATYYCPAWLYVPMGLASGEIREYIALPGSQAAQARGEHDGTPYSWHAWIRQHFRLAASSGVVLDSELLPVGHK